MEFKSDGHLEVLELVGILGIYSCCLYSGVVLYQTYIKILHSCTRFSKLNFLHVHSQ